MNLDARTDSLLRDMCLRGPVEYADMVGIIERYQPSVAPLDFAAYVQAARLSGAHSAEAAAVAAVKRLQAEEDRRSALAEQFKGHPCERQVREAFGLSSDDA